MTNKNIITITPEKPMSIVGNPVRKCPVVKGTFGRIRMVPEMAAALVGALEAEPNCEWLVILTGQRLAGGLDLLVTGCQVPQEQLRSTGDVDLPEIELPDDCVGVLHSHHSMGAFFSSTDETKLNPRFPMSIVISTPKSGVLEDVHRGFSYLAEGRVQLPCGALGIIRYELIIEPLAAEPEPPPQFEANLSASLEDCARDWINESERHLVRGASCELVSREETEPKPKVWGSRPEIAQSLPPERYYHSYTTSTSSLQEVESLRGAARTDKKVFEDPLEDYYHAYQDFKNSAPSTQSSRQDAFWADADAEDVEDWLTRHESFEYKDLNDWVWCNAVEATNLILSLTGYVYEPDPAETRKERK